MGSGVFQCYNCKEYISVDAKECRFCKTPITPEVAQANALAQAEENRLEQQKKNVRAMLVGLAMVVAGLAITAVTFALASMQEGGGHYFITWGLVVFGGINFFRGLAGWIGNRK